MNINKKITHLIIVIIVASCFSAPPVQAQKVLIRGSAEKLIEDAKLMKQYEFEVLQWAINNALYDKFGSSVSSNYESLSKTSQEGQSITSHLNIRSNYINVFPNGVWLGNESDPVFTTYKDEKSNWWLRCEVTGWAEEVKTPRVDFTAKTLDGTDVIKNQTSQYISGESGYLYFKSAQKGYISVFFDDFINVQLCFPYNAMESMPFPIEGNKEYLLFDRNSATYIEKELNVDEIEFYTGKDLEFNLFYIIYSTEPYSLPILESEDTLLTNYSTFRSIPREKFQRWLQSNRLKNKQLQVEVIGITILGTNTE